MSAVNDKLELLREWSIYKSEGNFQKFVKRYKLSEEEQKVLVSAYDELNMLDVGTKLVATPNIDKALEIKSRVDSKGAKGKTEIKKSFQKEDKKDESKVGIDDLRADLKSDDRVFEKLEFKGDANEYFKIWIVNIFLTVITLGIYSAWAKVRTNRYFYANTFYKNSAFEYDANPINILKGRLIVVSIYALFIYSAQVLMNPFIAGGLVIFALIMTPFLVNKAIKFKLKSIKYRNVRFKYEKDIASFYKFFSIHFILNLVTVGLAYPYSLNEFKKLFVNNSKFGDRNFNYSGTSKGMYREYLNIIVGTLILGALVGFIMGTITSILGRINPVLLMFMPIIATYFTYFIILPVTKAIYDTFIKNYTWNNTNLDNNLFKSSLSVKKLGWIYVSNIFLILISAGLLTPWAKVRVAKYKCDNFFISSDDLSQFIDENRKDESAIGEEVDDFFDMDIGF